jgi:hypothetical protein
MGGRAGHFQEICWTLILQDSPAAREQSWPPSFTTKPAWTTRPPWANWVIGPLYQPILCLYHPAEFLWDDSKFASKVSNHWLSSGSAQQYPCSGRGRFALPTRHSFYLPKGMDWPKLGLCYVKGQHLETKMGKVWQSDVTYVFFGHMLYVCPSFLWLCESVWYVFPGKVWKDAKVQDICT